MFAAVMIATALAVFTYSQTRTPSQISTNSTSNGDAVLAHLNATINWYKNLTTKVAAGSEPSDAIYLTNARTIGAQVVRLAFQSAKAQAGADAQLNGTQKSANPDMQKYVQLETEVSQRIATDEAQIAALKPKSGKASKSDLQAQEQSLQGKLELDKSSLNAIQQMKAFVEGSGSGSSGLTGNINELARSVPEVMETQSGTQVNAPAPAAKQQSATRTGMIGQLVTLYEEMQSIRSIQQLTEQGESIRKIATDLRVPLRNELTGTLQQEKDLSSQTGVTKEQYDALTARFKALASALVPLSEEILVLDQSKSNLTLWSKAHIAESRSMLISILMRVGVIVISVAAILGLGEVWRRLAFRYVHEARRRRQLFLIRRFVMGFLIFLVIVLGFASEFSSLATFAGFVTAGIAVGLQTILLSVAAYFFVIGRYGISVGDRVSVAGVTGDVIDVGLVRFYLMEYAATGADLYPTGRIVVFSNAVLFQATTPLFKQLPGTRYTWHEAVLPLAPKADYEAVQKAVTGTIHRIYEEYDMKLLHHPAFESIDISVNPPEPEQRLQFSDSGPELIVRYPVDLNRAGEIDEKVTRALIDTIQRDDHLASYVNGSPKIRAAVKA
jgi:small-conductance mechanosensitive channel